MNSIFGNILITGGTGSWGKTLTEKLLKNKNIKKITILSRNEHKQVEMKRIFSSEKLVFKIGDIRDKELLDNITRNIDIVFHLAALKHVPICEENSWESVKTNIVGTYNVIQACIKNNVGTMVDVSTDKAVEPHNIYGITKACAEKLVTNSMHNYATKTRFVCIRGGNVVGTNGSVIPLFLEQLNKKNLITITDPSMTRYLFRTKDAIDLIFKAIDICRGGEIFVMRMKATTIQFLADSLIKLKGNDQSKQKIIGRRPGEKIHEVLVSKNEKHLTYEINPDLYVINPENISKDYSIPNGWVNMSDEEFSSDNANKLTFQELEELIINF